MQRAMARIAGGFLAMAAGVPLSGAAIEPARPGEVDVEFHVRNTGFNASGFIELYSEPAWDEPGCVFIRVPVASRKAFASGGIEDIAKHFAGRRVRARGRMEVLRFGEDLHPCIVVEDPGRIQCVEGAADFLPTAVYTKRELRGFALMLAPDLNRHPGEREEALGEMGKQLEAICEIVPADRLAVLRRARIWVEWEAKPRGAAEHHPSREWLVANGYNPEKAGDVEISHARHFVAWSAKTQPWMVMHELAHAYHHATREANGARIEAAYGAAMKAGLYDSVAHVDGRAPRKAYAANNPQEYFAELTEAYFGRNDFEPFDNADLRKHDPGGYALMRQVWGEQRTPSP